MSARRAQPARPVPVWRLAVALTVFAAAAGAVAVRLVDLQVVNRDFYQRHGDARALRTQTIAAHRGIISDRHGAPLAVSVPMVSVWAHPPTLAQASADWATLGASLGVSADRLAQRVARAADTGKEFVYLGRHLTPEQASAVQALRLDGLYETTEYRRFYPDGEVTGHLLGFTNIDDQGLEGLELAYDGHLQGVPGKKWVLRSRTGETIRELHQAAASPGGDLRLTLDARVQSMAYRELKAVVRATGARGGSAVVLKAGTADVLALVNQPAFNPNNRETMQPQNVRNRAVTDLIEPGSTLKPFSIAAALESGAYRPDSKVDTAPGLIRVGAKTFRDYRNYQQLDLAGILAKSSNVGVVRVALSLEPGEVRSVLQRVGFGRPVGSGMPGEAGGFLPPEGTEDPIARATMAFGYGVSVTPLQLALAYNVLASEGQLAVPRVVADEPIIREQVLAPEVANAVAQMLETVVAHGTATGAQVPGYRVAGKTGTAHISGEGGYQNSQYRAVFAGFLPASSPEVVIAVVVDQPQGERYSGGAVAAPLFARIAGGTMRLLGVPADAAPPPSGERASLWATRGRQ